MAKITFNQSIDPNDALLNIPNEIDLVTTAISSVFEIGDARFTLLRLEGADFTYSAPGVPSSGILTGFSLVKNGIVAVTVTGLAPGLTLPQVERLRLEGSPGALLRYLLASDDEVIGGAGNQVILSEGGNDTLDGGEGADYIAAGDGDDLVISRLGQGPTGGAMEILIGGDGIDYLIIDRSDQELSFVFDVLVKDTTTMLDGTRLSGFERMEFYSGSGDDVLAGGGLADIINAGAGSDRISGRGDNDTLSGGDGADHIDGGSGNDLITGDEGTDILDGGKGNDTIDGGAQADNLFGGDEDDVLNGGDGADYIEGGLGNDLLDGGRGPDVLCGGHGNDLYNVDNPNDVLFEADGEGFDVVIASGSYDLTSAAEIELLRTVDPKGKSALNLKGNGYANIIEGNAGANTINGLGGSDTLKGGRGRDIFVFNTELNKKNVDKVLDFRVKDDSFRLSKAVFKEITGHKVLDAAAFCVGQKAADADDRIIYNPRTGRLYYDADGSGEIKAILFAKLTKGLKLTELDFLI
ncbi:calcium-binding protein [Microvirga flavescens]|uniref:calcium-binding protein n=1 Tax=Microvirga flavescens TaxID=2249811 RepID=UPI000DDB6E04|nr:calcium-binding protein [Microvirga flavescens]